MCLSIGFHIFNCIFSQIDGANAEVSTARAPLRIYVTRKRKREQEKRQQKKKKQKNKTQVTARKIPRIPLDRPGLFAEEDGGYEIPLMGSKETQLPLSKRESNMLSTSESTYRSAGSKCIYQVRACRDEDGNWCYEGKSHNHMIFNQNLSATRPNRT